MWFFQITLIGFGGLALLIFFGAMTFFDFDANKWRVSIKGSWVGLSILRMMGVFIAVCACQELRRPQSIWTFGPLIVGWIIGQSWIIYYARKMNVPIGALRGRFGSF